MNDSEELINMSPFISEDRYLVVIFPDHTFLHLEETFTSTNPEHVDNPIDATKVKPRVAVDLNINESGSGE